jgi:hypothetical protein
MQADYGHVSEAEREGATLKIQTFVTGHELEPHEISDF